MTKILLQKGVIALVVLVGILLFIIFGLLVTWQDNRLKVAKRIPTHYSTVYLSEQKPQFLDRKSTAYVFYQSSYPQEVILYSFKEDLPKNGWMIIKEQPYSGGNNLGSLEYKKDKYRLFINLNGDPYSYRISIAVGYNE